MKRPLAGAWGGENGVRHFHAENLRRHIYRLRIDGLSGNEVHPVERLPVAAEIPLAPVAVRHVVVALVGHVAIADRLEIESIDQLIQCRDAPVAGERMRINLRFQQRRPGKYTGQTGQCLAPAQTEPPLLL
jgi:hypothetical protein